MIPTPRWFGLVLGLFTLVRAGAETPAYRDASLPLERRVEDLVGRMTLEEKTSLMLNTTPGVPRLGIPKYDWWNEGLHGVARAGHASVYPQAIGLAAMWDVELQQALARSIGLEGRAKFEAAKGTDKEGKGYYGLTFWSPNINIFRDPRWGRGQETYGEDPFLTGRLGVAFIQGLQGNDPKHLLAAACAKHFAVHSGPEVSRHEFDAVVGAADLHETYLPAFEAAVREAKVEIVMTAYNAINGVPCSIDPFLYDALKGWGFDGHVTSDCGSIEDLIQYYKRAADQAEAEALAVKAGLNVRCGWEASQLLEAVKRGLLSEQVVTERVTPLVRTLMRLGFFDPKEQVPYAHVPAAVVNSPTHDALALRAARESLVLLKNDGVLPLEPARLKRVAVIGPNADVPSALLGNYHGTPLAAITPLAGLKQALEPAVQVEYARGCDHVVATEGWSQVPTSVLESEGETGLLARLYATEDFTTKPLAIFGGIGLNFDWGKDPRSQRPFFARYTGELSPKQGGDYEFSLEFVGGCRLFLNETLVFDAWTARGEQTRTFARTLAAGEHVALRVEYLHAEGPAKMAFRWNPPSPALAIEEALTVAQRADVVVFVGGITAGYEGEEMDVVIPGFKGGDRTRIELPEVQTTLLKRLAALGKPVVFVNLSGSAMAFPWEAEHLGAIVQAWYPGQAGGTALADLVLGRMNPSGRLPVTFYRATEDMPSFEDYGMAGRTYRYFPKPALYPFGHGLSYTTFRYDNLRVAPRREGGLDVSVDITNTGGRDGEEVVQLYAVPPAAREIKALCGFGRVALRAEQTKTVRLVVPASALHRWNEGKGAMVIPAGEWTLQAGASSADVRATVRLGL